MDIFLVFVKNVYFYILLLKNNDFKKRKIQKRKSLKTVVDRDEQFNEINTAKKDFENTGDPVISTDTKKKEMVGSDVSVLLDQRNFGLNEENDPRFVANNILMTKSKTILSKGVFILLTTKSASSMLSTKIAKLFTNVELLNPST